MNDTLYILDTVGNKAEIYNTTKPNQYTIHYIITDKNCYEVKSGVQFGQIAG